MRANRGFTFVEMLVVVGIMAILTALMFASFSWNSTQKFETSVSAIQNLLTLAQTEAVARNTYVWVGFAKTTSAGQLAAAVAFSPDGTSTATPQALTPVYRWSNILMTDNGSVAASVRALLPVETGVKSLTTSGTTPETFPAMGQPAFVPNYTVTFTPQGEVLLTAAPGAQEGYQPAIDLGLQRTAGTAVPLSSNPDDVVLRVYGASGKIREFRLQ